ncbi:MAG: choice-of-anchor J domain-containing protein, partial [Anaerolineae bacterium]
MKQNIPALVLALMVLSLIITPVLADPGDVRGRGATVWEIATSSDAPARDDSRRVQGRRAAIWQIAASPNANVLSETFDTAAMPSGWGVVNLVGSDGWRFDDPKSRGNETGGSGNFAIADSDNAGPVDMATLLHTPVLDLSGHSVVKLKFKTYFKSHGDSTVEVGVSTDGGDTWTSVLSHTGADYQGTITVDISAVANQSNVVLGFYYEANDDWYWQIDDVVVEAVSALAAPSGLSATADNYDINLAWTDNSDNETHFRIERSPDGSSDWTQVGSVNADATSYADKDLTCNTAYYYRVRATSGASASAYSNVANDTTAACASATSISEDFTTPPPAGWNVVNNVGSDGWRFDDPASRGNETGGSGSFAIADSDHAGEVDMDTELCTPVINFAGQGAVQLKFKTHLKVYSQATADVDVSKDGGVTWTNVWRETADFQGPVTRDVSDQVADQSNVMLRFRYYNVNDDWYWQVDDVELTPLAAPAAPSGLDATLSADNAVNLSWTGDASGFKVERSPDSPGDWTQIADITDRATTYVDSDVNGGVTYYYRVRAYNGAGDSGYSNTANVTTDDLSVRTYDIAVSFYKTPTAAEKAAIEGNMRHFADAVYEMSNGAQKLGRVNIYSNGDFADRADIIWVQSCWPNAAISGRAMATGPGKRIEHCDAFSGYNFLGDDTGQRAGGYTLSHEWGHYFHSLFDEYQGDYPCEEDDPGWPCLDDIPVPVSLMDGGSWLAVDGNYNGLNFSTPLNNTGETAQHRMYGASAWETLVRPLSQDPRDGARSAEPVRIYHPELVAVAPAAGQAPSVELPGGQAAARSELSFNWVGGSGGLALQEADRAEQMLAAASGVVRQIVIDSSASMATAGKLGDVKAAVSTLVGEAQVGDVLGIINFAGAVTVTQALTDVTESNRDAIMAQVDGILAGGDAAAIGDALQVALNGLTDASVPTDTHRAVYLVTASENSTGTYPLSVIPDYQVEFVELYTFGYGAEQDAEATLRQMAEQTGGEYSAVGNLNELLDALEYADQATSLVVDVNVKTGWGWMESSTTDTVLIQADSSLGELEFEVAYWAA